MSDVKVSIQWGRIPQANVEKGLHVVAISYVTDSRINFSKYVNGQEHDRRITSRSSTYSGY